MSDDVRGSQHLKVRYSHAELQRLTALAELDGVELVEYFPIGIPDPEGGWGVLRVQPAVLPSVIGAILGHEKFPGLKIFPIGIPWEEFEVVFEAGAERG